MNTRWDYLKDNFRIVKLQQVAITFNVYLCIGLSLCPNENRNSTQQNVLKPTVVLQLNVGRIRALALQNPDKSIFLGTAL